MSLIPDGKHNHDIVETIVEILIGNYRKDQDNIENNYKSGEGRIASYPGPRQCPPRSNLRGGHLKEVKTSVHPCKYAYMIHT